MAEFRKYAITVVNSSDRCKNVMRDKFGLEVEVITTCPLLEVNMSDETYTFFTLKYT
jgi:hypothetical protein